MSTQVVKISTPNDPSSEGVFAAVGSALARIRDRAYALFETNGHSPSPDADWLNAERELFRIPDSELSETSDACTLRVSAPGFSADDLDVAVEPCAVTVCGKSEQRHSEGEDYSEVSKRLFRRYEFESPVDMEHATATLENGFITVNMPKAGASAPEAAPAKAPASKARAAAA